MKIRVDPQDLINEAAKTRTRIADREKYLERMNCLVEELRNHWEGSDYDAYKNNWDQAMSQNSKSPLHVVNRNQEMIAAFLMDAARRYEDLNDRMQKHVIIWNQNSYETSEFYKTKGTEFFIDSDKMRGYRMLIRMRLQTQFDQDEDTKKGIASLETAAQDAEDTEKTISALIKKIEQTINPHSSSFLNFLPIGISQFIVDDKISKIVALQGGSASTLYEKTLLLLLNNYEETKDESQLEMIVQLISEQNRGRDISAVPQWERDLLVLSYELLYPEKQSVMDAFLDPLIHHSDITLIEHVQNIKYLSYASPQPYHDALFEHLPKMSIEDINFTEPDLSAPGSHRPAAQYDPNNGKIYFNLAADSISDRGSYSALFHEVGHGVDIEMGMSSTALNDTVRNDVAAAIRAEIESHYPSPLSADDAFAINTIRESLMPGGYPLHDPDLIDIRNRVRHNFSNGALAAGDNDVASDVYGGVTGNVIRGSHVHSPEYWNIHQPSLEFFAGAFSRNITQHTNPLSSVNNNFPNASREFENLFN